MKTTRVPTNYAVTREQKRYIARQALKDKQDENTKEVLAARAKTDKKHEVPAGKKYFKHEYLTMKNPNTGATYQVKNPSYFSEHWKEHMAYGG
jgi:hypothetical protein